MPSSYTPLLRLELQAAGEKTNTWGAIANTNFGSLLEKCVAGAVSIDVTSGDVTLTALNGVDDQARCMILLVTGTPGVLRKITAPASSKTYVVVNGSNALIVLKSASTTGLAIAAGSTVYAVWNGSSFVVVGVSSISPAFIGTVTAVTGIGYGTGAGGLVAQSTSKSTTVVLSKICGQIETHSAQLAAGASVVFVALLFSVVATDVVILHEQTNTGSATDHYRCEIVGISSGLFYVRITNITATPLSEAVKLNYAVIKSVNA